MALSLVRSSPIVGNVDDESVLSPKPVTDDGSATGAGAARSGIGAGASATGAGAARSGIGAGASATGAGAARSEIGAARSGIGASGAVGATGGAIGAAVSFTGSPTWPGTTLLQVLTTAEGTVTVATTPPSSP